MRCRSRNQEGVRSRCASHMVLLVLLVHVLSASPPPPPCATSCTHAHCDNFNIRYGTYCGVGYTGCPGVKPCDAYDACCETHDACVTTESMMSQKCHAALTRCLHTALANHTTTWIEERGESAIGCSAEEIVKTMSNGMGVASLFSLFMGGAQHQPAVGHPTPHGSNAASAHGALGRPSLASTSMRFEGSHSSRFDELHVTLTLTLTLAPLPMTSWTRVEPDDTRVPRVAGASILLPTSYRLLPTSLARCIAVGDSFHGRRRLRTAKGRWSEFPCWQARIEKIKSHQAATRRKLTDRPWVGKQRNPSPSTSTLHPHPHPHTLQPHPQVGKRRTRELAEEAQGTESAAVEDGARSNPNPNLAGERTPEVSHTPADQARELRDQP